MRYALDSPEREEPFEVGEIVVIRLPAPLAIQPDGSCGPASLRDEVAGDALHFGIYVRFSPKRLNPPEPAVQLHSLAKTLIDANTFADILRDPHRSKLEFVALTANMLAELRDLGVTT